MGAFNKLMAFTFATLLAKPFTSWKAFEKGLIDEKGNMIRKPQNPPERDSLSGLKNLVRKVKRLLIKVVPDSRLLGFLITLFLLKKESEQDAEETQLLENIKKDLSKNELADIIDYLKILNKANFK